MVGSVGVFQSFGIFVSIIVFTVSLWLAFKNLSETNRTCSEPDYPFQLLSAFLSITIGSMHNFSRTRANFEKLVEQTTLEISKL